MWCVGACCWPEVTGPKTFSKIFGGLTGFVAPLDTTGSEKSNPINRLFRRASAVRVPMQRREVGASLTFVTVHHAQGPRISLSFGDGERSHSRAPGVPPKSGRRYIETTPAIGSAVELCGEVAKPLFEGCYRVMRRCERNTDLHLKALTLGTTVFAQLTAETIDRHPFAERLGFPSARENKRVVDWPFDPQCVSGFGHLVQNVTVFGERKNILISLTEDNQALIHGMHGPLIVLWCRTFELLECRHEIGMTLGRKYEASVVRLVVASNMIVRPVPMPKV